VTSGRLREPNFAQLNMSDKLIGVKLFAVHEAMLTKNSSRNARASSRMRAVFVFAPSTYRAHVSI
jgi:hypothetical protein